MPFSAMFWAIPPTKTFPYRSIHSLHFSHTTAAEIKEPPSVVYEDTIFITNLNQLLAIGSDQAVTDTDMTEDGFGRGKPLSYSDGTPAV